MRKDLGLSPICANCVIMLSDNIIIELYELSRNMNWLNGCVLSWHWHVMGLNLGGSKLNCLFAKISFGMNVKGQGNLSSLGAAKGAGKPHRIAN